MTDLLCDFLSKLLSDFLFDFSSEFMSDFIVIWCPIHCPISCPISYPIICFLNKFRKIYLTFLWNHLTIDWNDLTWNDLTMERNDRKSRFLVRSFVRTILFAQKTVISARFLQEREASSFFAITPCYMRLPNLIFSPIFVKPGLIVLEVGTPLAPIPESPISANPGLKILYSPPPPSRGRGGGVYSGFQVTGMIKGFLGVWNFLFRDFFAWENFGEYLFW